MVMMTDGEIYKYLNNLKNKSEFEMFRKCIQSNPNLISIYNEESNNIDLANYSIDPKNNNAFDRLNPDIKVDYQIKNHSQNINEDKFFAKLYIEMLNNRVNEVEIQEKNPYKIWIYSEVSTLKSGDFFGQNSMSSEKLKRLSFP